jgi:hypothetical protein
LISSGVSMRQRTSKVFTDPSARTCAHRERRARRQRVVEPLDGDRLEAGEPQRLPRGAVRELERQHAHAHQVGAVDALERLGDHRRTPSSIVPLAAQSRDEPVPYSLPAMITSGVPPPAYAIARRRTTSARHPGAVARPPPFLAGRQFVLEADVGEGAAHHHLVIAATRAVRVEVGASHAQRLQPLTGRDSLGDRAGGRDVVGGDGVAEHAEHPRVRDRRTPGGVMVMPSKYGGCFTYVLLSSHA